MKTGIALIVCLLLFSGCRVPAPAPKVHVGTVGTFSPLDVTNWPPPCTNCNYSFAGATNTFDTLRLQGVDTNHVYAFGRCIGGAQGPFVEFTNAIGGTKFTFTNQVVTFRSRKLGGFAAWGPVTVSSAGGTGCPGPRTAYAFFSKQYATNSATGTYTITDILRSDTKVQFFGYNGDSGCSSTTVSIPSPTFSPTYQFAVYFHTNNPSGTYPIWIQGFNP